jgi:hypothetical protein
VACDHAGETPRRAGGMTRAYVNALLFLLVVILACAQWGVT